VKPLALDLCCGLGGWAEGLLAAGWDVVGVDVEERFRAVYPGRFFCFDLRTLTRADFGKMEFLLVVASPPCQEFSRHAMPWTRKRNPPPPDKTIWQVCVRIAREAEAPLVLENVREAQNWMGPARAHYGAQYLWGDVPAILPRCGWQHRKKESLSSSASAERSKIPFDLAFHIGQVFHP